MIAAIDIGTNTVLLTIAHDFPPVRTISEKASITRLGQGVDTSRALDTNAMQSTLRCLREYKRLCDEADVTSVRCVGTSALRDAEGGDTFRREASRILGSDVEVISGSREAQLTFRGALTGKVSQALLSSSTGAPPLDSCNVPRTKMPVVAFDIGGGSTEIISGTVSGTITTLTSARCGSVRLAERFPGEPEAARPFIRNTLETQAREVESLVCHTPQCFVVGIAGTVATLWALENHFPVAELMTVDGALLSTQAVHRWAELLPRLNVEQRMALPGMSAGRADVIAHGAIICAEILDWLEADHMAVTARGVRHGLLEELLKERGTDR